MNMNGQNTAAGHAEQSHAADDHGTVASHDTQRSHRSYDSRRSRGYPTETSRRRRDDESIYSSRKECQESSRHSWEGDRSRGRSKSQHQIVDKGYSRYGDQSTDRQEGGREQSRYDRSRSYAPAFEREYNDERVGDFQRGRSGSVTTARSEPPFQNRRRFFSGSKSRSPGRLIPRLPRTREMMEWPPCFDNEGSSFVFHPSSGMFYEEKSEFFYDPKAKLYYGVKKAAYFRYDEDMDPPFVETQRADASLGTPLHPVEPPVTLPLVAAVGSTFEKPKIAIHLKTKKIKKPKALINTSIPQSPPLAVVTKIQKEQVANIEKWQEKQAELKAFQAPIYGVTAAMAAEEISRTVKGEPICVVCKRKFATLEKLRLHETKSELHKVNLEKAAQLASVNRPLEAVASTAAEAQQYYDRAEKRRRLHGPGTLDNIVPIGAAQASILPLAPPEGIGETNIGNKLLQKMGWQSGSSLGKKSEDEGHEKSSVDIRKDWDRIEAMATAGAAARSNN